ncbi:MAG: NAD(P)/FAD-dependent oxidoreductase [Bacilli bacterium]|nr:NAD(P)/FAD-dependent oxidoreductase [Bacilli bacterium]
MYDVVIIGAGVVGASIARELSKYKLKTLVLDKENDVGNVTSMANSAIVHSGYDPKPGTKKAFHNVRGNSLYDDIAKNLDVEFKRIGSLTCAINEEELEVIEHYLPRAKENNVEVKLLNKEETKALEPFISDNVIASLYAPSAGIINPFELTVALMENAMDNGVTLKLNTEVIDVTRTNNGYIVKTNDEEIEAKVVINSAGLYSDKVARMLGIDTFEVKPRKGEYFVLDHFNKPFVSHVIFPTPTAKGKGILVTPTTHGNYLVGPSSEWVEDKEDLSTDKLTLDAVRSKSSTLVNNIPFQYMIRQFSGLRATGSTGDFIIENHDGFIVLGGIESPGLASAPSIALEVVDLVKENITLEENKDFNPVRRKINRLSKMSEEERNELIKADPRYGRIVCRCESISEGEVVDAIHRNAGARTIKGVKKRCRPGFGKCQGGFCEPLIVEILARELNKDPMEIKYDTNEAYILQSETKGGKK